MKYLKTTDNDYIRADSVKVFSVRNKKLYAFTDDKTFALKEFESDAAAQAYLDALIAEEEEVSQSFLSCVKRFENLIDTTRDLLKRK